MRYTDLLNQASSRRDLIRLGKVIQRIGRYGLPQWSEFRTLPHYQHSLKQSTFKVKRNHSLSPCRNGACEDIDGFAQKASCVHLHPYFAAVRRSKGTHWYQMGRVQLACIGWLGEFHSLGFPHGTAFHLIICYFVRSINFRIWKWTWEIQNRGKGAVD